MSLEAALIYCFLNSSASAEGLILFLIGFMEVLNDIHVVRQSQIVESYIQWCLIFFYF